MATTDDFSRMPSHNHGYDPSCPEKAHIGKCMIDELKKERDELLDVLRVHAEQYRNVPSIYQELIDNGERLDPTIYRVVEECYDSAADDLEFIILSFSPR